MKTGTYKLRAFLMLILGVSLSMTQCTELPGEDDYSAPGEDLTAAERSGILFMREEEKLARDVYLYLYDIHSIRTFLNISKSEQAHMDAMLYLIDTLGLVDPVGENPPGVFHNEELQQLYDELIERGSKSREEALRVGALIEEVDIIDLRSELEENAENEEVVRVYSNLCRASENHLRAFVGVLRLYDIDYEPIMLEPEDFDLIIKP